MPAPDGSTTTPGDRSEPADVSASEPVDPAQPEAVWSAVVGRAESTRALSWLRKTRLVELTGDAAAGWAATIEPLPGHGDLVAFATRARLEPAAALVGQVLGVRAQVTMRPRAGDDPKPAASDGRRVAAGDVEAVDALPIVRKMKEVFGDYHVRLIAQRREVPPAPAPSASEADDEADGVTPPDSETA